MGHKRIVVGSFGSRQLGERLSFQREGTLDGASVFCPSRAQERERASQWGRYLHVSVKKTMDTVCPNRYSCSPHAPTAFITEALCITFTSTPRSLHTPAPATSRSLPSSGVVHCTSTRAMHVTLRPPALRGPPRKENRLRSECSLLPASKPRVV